MRSNVIFQLQEWKKNPGRKPLIVQGIRQVGKTWLLKKFGETSFEHTAYFNFDKQPELKQFFLSSKEPARIIENLSFVLGQSIHPEKTLIIFDEIQECNDALNSLKYFNEEAPEYAIICAGSLLGVALSRGASFPVGKVDFLQLYPFTFSEFLSEADPGLAFFLGRIEEIAAIPDIFFNKLIEKLKMYYLSGGMPEAMMSLLKNRDVELTQKVLLDILQSYQLDFSKHVDNRNIQRIYHIWNSLPSQLARENKKFLYQSVRSGARAREYEEALLWLINAGLVLRIHCTVKPSIPLLAYDDLTNFKIYLPDVGLLRRLSLLNPVAITEGNRLFTEFKGALTENFILQSLASQFEGLPRYWKSENIAEVDFLIQYLNEIFPVEVKSDVNVRSKSLAIYRNKYNPGICIRYSLKNLSYNNGILNIPLFMVDYTKKLIKMCYK